MGESNVEKPRDDDTLADGSTCGGATGRSRPRDEPRPADAGRGGLGTEPERPGSLLWKGSPAVYAGRGCHLDRGFYRVHLASALEELDVEFVMRAPQTRKVQRFIADHDEDTFVAEYEMARPNPPTGRTTVRLVVVPHRSREDDHSCLVTNREVTRDLAHPLAEAYRRRWGIGTSYRKVTDFLPKTSSPTFSVRVFYFLFAVALYNLWVLTNLLLASDRAVGSTPVLPTALFRQSPGPIPDG